LSLLVSLLFAACLPTRTDQPRPAATPSPAESLPGGLDESEVRTLTSLRLVDPYPLYTMEYAASYAAEMVGARLPERRWSCSLFAALGDPSSRLYGRNFDWDDSPAMLLFTDPPNGYASVSMVDIAYLLGDLRDVTDLEARPLPERRELLRAPHLPFDGMNEQGLAVGMAAVPQGDAPFDPDLPTVDDLELMRWMLDRASTVDEAVEILRGANIAWGNGPPIHYLIADDTGRAALVEYVQGKMVVLPNDEPSHLATNFFVSACRSQPDAEHCLCPRYDRMVTALRSQAGVLRVPEALDLLHDVSNATTQWSVVYDLTQRSVHVVMGTEFETVHRFDLRR
jgi:hypothetical protein